MIRFYKILSIVLLILLMSISCDDTITNEDVDNIEIPESNVSLSEHLYPMFSLKCGTSCHDDQTFAGGYSMSTWSGIVQAGIVNPGSPETSRLIWRINWEQYGFDPMPPLNSRLPLTEEQRQGVWTWIKEGAKNN